MFCDQIIVLLPREIAFRKQYTRASARGARGKMIKKVSRHNKQVVEMLNVFGAARHKMF